MAMVMMLMRNWDQPEVHSALPMSSAKRDAERRRLDANRNVYLYEIVPTLPEEMAPGAWGQWMLPKKMLRTWRETVDALKKG